MIRFLSYHCVTYFRDWICSLVIYDILGIKFRFYFKIVEKGLSCGFIRFIVVRFLTYYCITYHRDWIYSLVICVTDIFDLLLLPLQLAAGPGWVVVGR